jgi:hypothetical protein
MDCHLFGSQLGQNIFLSSETSVRPLVLPRHLVSMYRWLFPRGKSGWGVKLTFHLRLVRKFRMCGVIILPLLCAFMGSTGTNNHCNYYNRLWSYFKQIPLTYREQEGNYHGKKEESIERNRRMT